jgi:hypothetical protein
LSATTLMRHKRRNRLYKWNSIKSNL